MNITADNTKETRFYVRDIGFEDVAPILIAHRNYSHGGKEFLPDHASARWNHGDSITEITVYGYVLKKDRTTGQQRTDVMYVTPASRYWGDVPFKFDPDAPAWLLELFGIEVPA